MSLKTWKAEFYPVQANYVKKKDALAHSLKKWQGLTKANLEKHRVRSNVYVIEDGRNTLWIDNTSCSLCAHFSSDPNCPNCPLSKARRGQSCCDRVGDELSPYDDFIYSKNPQPMIRLIKKAIKQTNE